jgi:GH15 family glucan-1,4-alpha-glucosidase
MAKTIILSNGNLNIGLNEFGLVSDFYFPDNAYENHTLGKDMFHRIGVRVDGVLSWLNDGDWDFSFEYLDDGLISKIKATNKSLKIRIETKDAVLFDKDILVRSIKIINILDANRKIDLFLHQNFSINSSNHLADTVQYIPNHPAILHYRGKRAFVVTGKILRDINGSYEWSDFDQHTVGLFGIENKEGSWRDAEDGELAGSNVEHGQTDSVIRFRFELQPKQMTLVQYSISCADSHELAFNNSKKTNDWLFQKELEQTHKEWQSWLKPAQTFAKRLDRKYQKSFLQSFMVAKSHLSHTGAPIASNDSEMLNHARDDYSYCWPRDALFALWPFVRLGYDQELISFFDFCEKIIKPEGYLMHKYLPNGELGPSWHPYAQYDGEKNLPIQVDETAGIVFLVSQFHSKFHNIELLRKYYSTLVKPMSDFLVSFTDNNGLPKANYELWEMYFSSFYGAFIFGLFDLQSNETITSLKTLESRFDTAQNIGIPRFENDVYYRQNDKLDGNFWIITTLWRAEYYIANGENEQAKTIIDWVLERASSSNILPEQIDPNNLNWLSVAPLTWSQSEWVSALLDLIASEEK